MDITQVRCTIGQEEMIFETGKVGRQANGAVLATQGGTVVFSSAVMAKKASTLDYFPLQVHYSEKFYAAGRIPGGFIKREGRPKDKEILVSRLIDRPIRPLFPKGFFYDVQVQPTTFSYDGINSPDILAMNAASASLSISDIPFDGPVGAVRVALVDGKYVVNPTRDEIKQSLLDLVVSGTDDAILMVEGHAEFVGEDQFMEALQVAHEGIKKIVAVIGELVARAGKPKAGFDAKLVPVDLEAIVREYAYEKLQDASNNPDKLQRAENVAQVGAETVAHFVEQEKTEEELKQIESVLHDLEKEIVRKEILEQSVRPDGRKLDEIRQITIDVPFLPRTHGSGLFTRGQTQALVVCTLGTPLDTQRLDDLYGESEKNFMLHYNFPPFSVGETGRLGAPGRREIGHGMLAERALLPIIPTGTDFPYTVRLVSEIMESNGSSSMASVCGGCLALMDAGVQIKDQVAGIAMGLVMDSESGNYKVLTDIQGVEDHLGDMDFKITGSRNGITACQMDIKVKGITFEIIKTALEQARHGRLFILDRMQEAMPAPREELSPLAPKIMSLQIDTEKIGYVIGKGGETIRSIQDDTNTEISISIDGLVSIASSNTEDAMKALNIIKGMTADLEIGEIYDGKVKRIMDFGAFVELLPGKEGLCHISKLANHRVNKVRDVVKEGDTLRVKVIEIDKLGRINLSAVNID